MKRIYLDWAATALPDDEIIRNAAENSINSFGNPSSPHHTGKNAAKIIEENRNEAAGLLGTSPDKLFLTSGGTESNNIIISSLLNKKRTGNIIISGIEHSAVFEPAMMLERFGWEVRIVDPEPNGIISADKFCSRIDENTRMAAVIMVNNETGSVQPIEEIGRKIIDMDPKKLIHFHTDAVQAAGKYLLNLDDMPVDSASMSSHKFRGPRGAGLLYLNGPIEPIYCGGGQERGLRHGTENTFGLLGTAASLKKSVENIAPNQDHALSIKKILIEVLSEIKGIKFNSGNIDELLNPDKYSPYILSLSINPIPGEILVRVVSDKGFDIATGSACATGKKKKSRIMEAMGISNEDAFSTIRISTGTDTTTDEIKQFCEAFTQESALLIKSLRR